MRLQSSRVKRIDLETRSISAEQVKSAQIDLKTRLIFAASPTNVSAKRSPQENRSRN